LRMHWLIRLYLKSLCSLFDSVYPLPNILVPPVPLISAFNFLARRSQLRMDNFVTSFLCEYLVSSHSGPTRFQNVVLVFHHPLNLTRIVAQTLRHTEKLSARCHRTLSLNIHAKGYDHDKVGGHDIFGHREIMSTNYQREKEHNLMHFFVCFPPVAAVQSQTVGLFRALVACPLEEITPGIQMNSKLHRQMRENSREKPPWCY
jgi:hypothetical protein